MYRTHTGTIKGSKLGGRSDAVKRKLSRWSFGVANSFRVFSWSSSVELVRLLLSDAWVSDGVRKCIRLKPWTSSSGPCLNCPEMEWSYVSARRATGHTRPSETHVRSV